MNIGPRDDGGVLIEGSAMELLQLAARIENTVNGWTTSPDRGVTIQVMGTNEQA